MDAKREECCTGMSSGTVVHGGDRSSDYHFYYEDRSGRQPCRRITSRSLLSQWLSCIIVFLALGGVGRNQGMGFATARITLPVTRSFSQMKGSGTAKGESGGMTPEHAQQLRDHDSQRHFRLHGRFLTSTTVADFPLAGNDYEIGLYYTEIGLGTPSSTYYVQVDTGSDLLWVNCNPCPTCPTSSDLDIPLRLYNPGSSSTSSNTSCSSQLCTDAAKIAESYCDDNSCYYSFSYGDESTAMGYLVDDAITYDTGVAAPSNSSDYVQASAKVTFGCGFNQTGKSLITTSRATDGIMGFGSAALSVITQLALQGLTTYEFAHCLQGDTGEGGIFVIGDVQEPGVVYTSIVPDQYHYNVVLESISMGGTTLNIPSSVFKADPSNADSGTIFDSGTTLAIIVDQAYDAFKDQLLATATVPAIYFKGQEDTPCFDASSSDLDNSFPNVTLQFNGTGAAMQLIPTNYLYFQSSDNGASVWCLGWSRSSDSGLDGLSILGDIVLKNKLVVYDLASKHIGWVDYNCMSSVSVSNGTADEVLNPSSMSGSHYLRAYHPLAVLICSVVFMYAAAFL